jgi:cysteine sulfinate desulfinase/cysteine desulfurase-like protein
MPPFDMSLVQRGARVRRVRMYDDPARASVAGMVRRLRAGLTRRTRVVALTWVHSSTGVKLPLRELAAAVGGRAEVYFTDDDRRLLVQMKSRIPVIGSLNLFLSSYTPGTPVQAAR